METRLDSNQAPHAIRDALETVLAYLWEDEQRHYADQEPEHREGHVFEALRTLQTWLDQMK